MYMYVQVCIFMYMYIACTYMFIHVHTFINMYIHVCTMYRALCTDLQILVHVVRIPDDVQTLLKRVRTLICPFGCCFFICPAGWPVGWDWLLPGVMPNQVQAHYIWILARYVYVRCRTYTLRHRTSDVRYRKLRYRTSRGYDVVCQYRMSGRAISYMYDIGYRTSKHTISHVTLLLYDIVCPTYDIVC